MATFQANQNYLEIKQNSSKTYVYMKFSKFDVPNMTNLCSGDLGAGEPLDNDVVSVVADDNHRYNRSIAEY